MAVGAPTLVSPSGPRSPWDPFRFRFPDQSTWPDRYDIQCTSDPTFGVIDLWHYTQQSVELIANVASPPYLGAAPVIGTKYYWRARGRLGASEVGPWSRVTNWKPDPSAVERPYDNWARDLLEAGSTPRPVIVLGSILPEGNEVLALLGTEYAGRWRVRDDRHPPPTDQLVAVYGLTFHVDHESGWEVAGMTSDVPPGEV